MGEGFEQDFSRPALTPEARENQMIALAMDETEYRIRSHKASSQELCHFLELATIKAKNDQKLQEMEMALKEAKTAELKDKKESSLNYQAVLDALRRYSGNYTPEEEENFID